VGGHRRGQAVHARPRGERVRRGLRSEVARSEDLDWRF
jgi:hypothetical protein